MKLDDAGLVAAVQVDPESLEKYSIEFSPTINPFPLWKTTSRSPEVEAGDISVQLSPLSVDLQITLASDVPPPVGSELL